MNDRRLFYLNKKPFLFTMALAVCCFFGGLWVSSAQADTGIVTGSVVNLRSEPSASSSLITQLKKGDLVTLIEMRGQWYKVKTADGTVAFINSELLEEINAGSTPSGAAPTVTSNRRIQVLNGPVNARSGPGANFDKLAVIQDQAIYAVQGEKDGWYQINLENGSAAYVAGWLVQEIGHEKAPSNDAEAVFVMAPVASKMPTIPSNNNTDSPMVILDGKEMQFEVRPIIENGRTLFPLRAIFEALGANVEWNESSRTITATKESIVVVLPINASSSLVNNVVHHLDVPARIVNGRTLVPLRFVSEALGGNVAWDDETKTITINSENRSTITQVMVIEKEANLREGPAITYPKTAVARSGEHLSVVGEKEGWYQVSRGGRTSWIAGWLVQAATAGKETTTSQNHTVQTGEAGFLTLSHNNGAAGYQLLMQSSQATAPIITTEGNQVIYSFAGVKLNPDSAVTSFCLGNNSSIRIPVSAQTTDDTTRVAIELPRPYYYESKSEANGCRQVFLIPPQLQTIDDYQLANGNQVVRIHSTSPITYQECKQDGQLTVNLAATYRGQNQNSYELQGTLADHVQVEEGTNRNTHIKINLKRTLENYQITSNPRGDILSLILAPQGKSAAARPTKINVVLDPGHGGRDPGVNRNLNEKDITLSIALKARSILETDENLNIIMTRAEDIALGPDEASDLMARTAIANQLPGDLFVAIHCNGIANPAPHGTETYYYLPADKPALTAQELQRATLASLLQKSMIGKLGLTDRGVKHNQNHCVLRETNMPSALVEVCFISNANEERLLGTENYQQLAAQSIAEAIKSYIMLLL